MTTNIMACCIFGHRTIRETEKIKAKIYEEVERLIIEKGVETFLFGSGSRFDRLCLETVTGIKEKYPHIKRIYVRAEYPNISEKYREYLLKSYDETYYPERIRRAGRAAYVERNREMIDSSRYCLVYYDEEYVPEKRKSGTKLAYGYAENRKKEIINIFPRVE